MEVAGLEPARTYKGFSMATLNLMPSRIWGMSTNSITPPIKTGALPCKKESIKYLFGMIKSDSHELCGRRRTRTSDTFLYYTLAMCCITTLPAFHVATHLSVERCVAMFYLSELRYQFFKVHDYSFFCLSLLYVFMNMSMIFYRGATFNQPPQPLCLHSTWTCLSADATAASVFQ